MRVLILIPFLLGCGPFHYRTNDHGNVMRQCSPPVLVGISSNVVEKDRKYIIAAFEFWNKEIGKQVFFDMGIIDMAPDAPGASAFVLVGWANNYTASGFTLAKHVPWTYTNGCFAHSYVAITMPFDEIPIESMKYTAMMHEMGHVLGLRDLDEPGHIMSGKQSIKQTDIPHLTDDEREAMRLFY